MTTTTPTEYSARVTRDGSDFQAELVAREDGREVAAYLVGWFDTHALALAAANEALTDALVRQAAETCDGCGAAGETAEAAPTGRPR